MKIESQIRHSTGQRIAKLAYNRLQLIVVK
jgi:hypothetical protein